jgi:transcriptional regulator with XRE-family HTH domain
MSHTPQTVKQLPSPSVKKLLREHGYTLMDVARRMKRSHSLVSRVVSKKATSEPVLEKIAEMLNERRSA